LDWELRGDPKAGDKLSIILVHGKEEVAETETVLFGQGAEGEDENRRQLIPQERQDTRAEKITIEIEDSHEILEQWSEGYNFKFKAFVTPGNRLIIHEFRY
jgi:hypothetical protein